MERSACPPIEGIVIGFARSDNRRLPSLASELRDVKSRLIVLSGQQL
jgi:hypothetical protein